MLIPFATLKVSGCWNSDIVEVTQLAKTEQEIHVTVKVLDSNLS